MSVFFFALIAGLAMSLLLGWPVAVLLGFRSGLRSLGMGGAFGLSILLIWARAAQMIWPIAEATPWLLVATVVVGGGLWSAPSILQRVRAVCDAMRVQLRVVVIVLILVAVGLNAPLLFHGAIQFDGSRNADSLTFTTSARYALWHAFYGAPDFSPAHPSFTIARGFFGDGAMQPRPAAEAFLAWLSRIRGADPMYLYNGLQTAGMLLAGLAVFGFLPAGEEKQSVLGFAVLAVIALACPSLLFLSVNSNFANALTLASATGYVALGVMPRRAGTFVAAVIFLASILSGYSEILPFMAAIRGFAVIGDAATSRDLRGVAREVGFLALEMAVACLVVPWSALGTWSAYVTSAVVSHAGASDLAGNLYAGVPLALTAAVILWASWSDLGGESATSRARSLFVGVLVAFALSQLAMWWRCFGYGGMKLSEYYVTSLCGLLVACGASTWSKVDGLSWPERLRHVGVALSVVIASVMAWRDARMISRSWEFARDRQVTRDLVTMGRWVREHAPNELIAMGKTPASFYYGHWVPYVIDAHFVFDWSQREQAGYLEPYLRKNDTAHFADARMVLVIDGQGAERPFQADDVAAFGRVHLQRAPTR